MAEFDFQCAEPAIASRTYDITMPELSPNGRLDATAVAVLARSLVDLKILPTELHRGLPSGGETNFICLEA